MNYGYGASLGGVYPCFLRYATVCCGRVVVDTLTGSLLPGYGVRVGLGFVTSVVWGRWLVLACCCSG